MVALYVPGPNGPRVWATAAGASTTTLNPSDKDAGVTLSGGDLTMTVSSGSPQAVRSVASFSSGKKHYEVTSSSGGAAYDFGVGVSDNTAGFIHAVELFNGDPNVYLNAGSIGTAVNYAVSQVISVAIDADNNRIWYRKNGGDWNENSSYDPATNVGGIDISALSKPWFAIGVEEKGGGSNAVQTFNFGATPYVYTAPSGFGDL